MANYYCDDGSNPGGGGNAGTSANPWLNTSGFQTLLDTLAANDTGYVRGSYMVDGTGNDDRGLGAVTLDIDTNSAIPYNGQVIRLIGLEAKNDWIVDGNFCVVDAGSASQYCFLINNIDGWAMENFEVENSVHTLIGMTNTDHANYWSFLNLYGHDSGSSFIGRAAGSTREFRYTILAFCHAADCIGDAYLAHAYSALLFCSSVDGSSHGFTLLSGTGLIGCLAHNHSGRGFVGAISNTFYNCVSDGNGLDGIYTGYGPSIMLGSRITNNNIGVNANTALIWDLYNFYSGNTAVENGTLIIHNYKGQDTRLTSGLEGYEDRGNDKFNLVLGAAGYRTGVGLPDGLNHARFPRGLPTMPIMQGRK